MLPSGFLHLMQRFIFKTMWFTIALDARQYLYTDAQNTNMSQVLLCTIYKSSYFVMWLDSANINNLTSIYFMSDSCYILQPVSYCYWHVYC